LPLYFDLDYTFKLMMDNHYSYKKLEQIIDETKHATYESKTGPKIGNIPLMNFFF